VNKVERSADVTAGAIGRAIKLPVTLSDEPSVEIALMEWAGYPVMEKTPEQTSVISLSKTVYHQAGVCCQKETMAAMSRPCSEWMRAKNAVDSCPRFTQP
jgi:hypothetical protein